MAIRIDLLPKYVGLKRVFKRVAAVCAFLVVAFGTGLFLWWYREDLRLQTLKTNVAQVEPVAAKAKATQTRADAKVAEAAPLQTTVDFFVAAARTGSERAAILDLIRRYIYNGALVGSLDISNGTSATMTASVRTPDDYARFLLNLRQGATPTGILFSGPAEASGIKGYPAGSATSTPAAPTAPVPGAPPTPPVVAPVDTGLFEVFPNQINASATLKDPITVPVAPGDTAPAAPAAAPGAAPAAPAKP